MFCPEDRIPRELFWAGFGFQVWCQMLTFIVKNKESALFIIDEPDIYLHSDMQRQLLSILKELGPSIVIATHSTEIIIESDPDEILIINKKNRSAKRLKEPSHLKEIFSNLGSNINPTITQLAKTKNAVFVEGKDFQVINSYASKLNFINIALRSDFAVIPAEGFNPIKVRYYIDGIESTLGMKINVGVIFDRDYRTESECKDIKAQLSQFCKLVTIHERKELENFILVPSALKEALAHKLAVDINSLTVDFKDELMSLSDSLKVDVYGKFYSHQSRIIKNENKHFDDSTVASRTLARFESLWSEFESRMRIIPGKKNLASLNTSLQERYGISLTIQYIIRHSNVSHIPIEMKNLIIELDKFCKTK